MFSIAKRFGEWIWAIWTRPTPQQQMLDIMREVVAMQKTQAEFFNTLAKSWTEPVPVQSNDYVSSDDRAVLADIQDAASRGDDDAKLLLGDPKALHEYLSLFH